MTAASSCERFISRQMSSRRHGASVVNRLLTIRPDTLFTPETAQQFVESSAPSRLSVDVSVNSAEYVALAPQEVTTRAFLQGPGSGSP